MGAAVIGAVAVEVAGHDAGGQLHGLPAHGGRDRLEFQGVGDAGAYQPLDLFGDGGGELRGAGFFLPATGEVAAACMRASLSSSPTERCRRWNSASWACTASSWVLGTEREVYPPWGSVQNSSR